MKAVKRHPVLRYSASSGPLGLLGSYIICKNKLPLKAARGREACFFFIPDEQFCSNPVCYFLFLICSVFSKNPYCGILGANRGECTQEM